jgi:lysophospholipase L1-like esterase
MLGRLGSGSFSEARVHPPLTWSRSVLAVLLAGVSLGAAPVNQAGDRTKPDPARFEKDIAAFEAEDRRSPPKPAPVLFVGSSSIRYWDTAKAFPTLTTITRGFGGSHVSDNIYYADRTIVRYKPRVVVFYAGDADVAAGKSAEQIFADFKTFIGMIHAKLPGTPLVIIGIKPSPAHWKQIEAIRRTNELVRAHVAADRLVSFVDVVDPLLGSDGRPRPECYGENGLNLNDTGYAAWTSAVRPAIERAAKR